MNTLQIKRNLIFLYKYKHYTTCYLLNIFKAKLFLWKIETNLVQEKSPKPFFCSRLICNKKKFFFQKKMEQFFHFATISFSFKANIDPTVNCKITCFASLVRDHR